MGYLDNHDLTNIESAERIFCQVSSMTLCSGLFSILSVWTLSVSTLLAEYKN